jgi:hypothetical protein
MALRQVVTVQRKAPTANGAIRLANAVGIVRNRSVTTYGLPHVGSELRRQYLTELEAAHGRDFGRRFSMPRNTALDECEKLRALIAKFRAAIDRKVKRANALYKPPKTGEDAAKAKPANDGRAAMGWEPSLDDCKAVQAITTAAERAVAMEERLRKMIEIERKGYTPEQLEAVWQHNLRQSAAAMGASDWWDLLRIGFGDDVARVLVRLQFGEDVLAGLEGS